MVETKKLVASILIVLVLVAGGVGGYFTFTSVQRDVQSSPFAFSRNMIPAFSLVGIIFGSMFVASIISLFAFSKGGAGPSVYSAMPFVAGLSYLTNPYARPYYGPYGYPMY